MYLLENIEPPIVIPTSKSFHPKDFHPLAIKAYFRDQVFKIPKLVKTRDLNRQLKIFKMIGQTVYLSYQTRKTIR